MTNIANNPWAGMPQASRRRISADLPQDFFWITDIQGRYGLYVESVASLAGAVTEISLKGISIYTNGSAAGSELFLMLARNEDWELFLSLCTDLTSACAQLPSSADWIRAIHQRLRRWQRFLKEAGSIQLSLEQQMGLFSELSFMLAYLIPVHGVKESLIAWVGPDFGKQDFSLKDRLVEIKSYSTSKGPIVQISSVHQLDNSGKPLALISYGLTLTDKGSSVRDLAERIIAAVPDGNDELLDILYGKLAQYGYFDAIPANMLHRFVEDKISAFNVSEAFPRLISKDVSPQIVSVKYTVDLSKCLEFEISDLTSIN
jgi:hypothetical protein